MEYQDFTKEEMSAIKSLKRAFKKCPNTLRLYGVDRSLSICKVGVSSDALLESIIECGLNSGIGLSDMHDDNNNGEDNSPIC